MTILQPILRTERLSLMPADPALAPAMLAYQLKNRDHLAPWDPTPGARFYTETFWQARFRLRCRDWQEGRGASYLLCLNETPDVVIGSLSFNNLVRGVLQTATLGYSIDRDCQGQGMMREALQEAIRFAFDVLRLHRLQANYQPHNQRSAGLLARLGFVIEGQAKDYLYLNGAWRDHVLTALVNPDFLPMEVAL